MLARALSSDFGSVDRWRDEFVAMANGQAAGSGWVLLVYVPRDRRLINQYVGDLGQTVAGGIPILALDMYEHAYHIDFGANVKAYVDTFIRNIDWNAVFLSRCDSVIKLYASSPRSPLSAAHMTLPCKNCESRLFTLPMKRLRIA
jgi:Fe-Mn family superoxide dismutase